MFSNNSVMDLPHFTTDSPANKMKRQGRQQQLLFLSDITNPKSKSIPWLKNDKQHRNAIFEHGSFGPSLELRPKPLPLSDRRNQPLPTLPLSPSSSASSTPPISPSLSTPSSSTFSSMKSPTTPTSLLPTYGRLQKKQDDSFLKFLEHKHVKPRANVSSKSTTTSSTSSVKGCQSNYSQSKNAPTPILPTLRSLPSVSSHSSRKTASNHRHHQPTPILVHKMKRGRSSSISSANSSKPKEIPTPPSSPSLLLENSVNAIIAQLPSTKPIPTTMISPTSTPPLMTTITASLSTPLTVSPSLSSSSSSSSSSALSTMNTHGTKNKFNSASYPLSQKSYEEQDRMVAQHYLLRTAFNGNDYMASGMTSSLKQGCIVLDMGCGTGTWTMELATAYPNSHFIGLDQLALFPRDIKPKNSHFATLDLTVLPLPIPDASVDYIFQRDLNWALMANQWPLLVKEYLRILKPGGWIELMEMDIESQSNQQQERTLNDKLIYGLSMRQQDPYVARRLPSILAINGFRRVSSQFQSLPLGWGKAHQHQNETKSKSTSNNIHHMLSPTSSSTSLSSASSSSSSSAICSKYAQAAASQYKFMLMSLCPWLSTVMGCSSDKYMTIVDQLESEWNQAHTYIKWHSAVAQKPLQ